MGLLMYEVTVRSHIDTITPCQKTKMRVFLQLLLFLTQPYCDGNNQMKFQNTHYVFSTCLENYHETAMSKHNYCSHMQDSALQFEIAYFAQL